MEAVFRCAADIVLFLCYLYPFFIVVNLDFSFIWARVVVSGVFCHHAPSLLLSPRYIYIYICLRLQLHHTVIYFFHFTLFSFSHPVCWLFGCFSFHKQYNHTVFYITVNLCARYVDMYLYVYIFQWYRYVYHCRCICVRFAVNGLAYTTKSLLYILPYTSFLKTSVFVPARSHTHSLTHYWDIHEAGA